MKTRLLHTPEGVRDIYNHECKEKLFIQDKLHKVLERYNYHDIQTPTFEFLDTFNREKGTVGVNDMYKFVDRDGEILVLRPDITPSIARCVSKYYEDEALPIRLGYMGNTYLNNSSYQGKLKEITQLGAELINDSSPAADAEMIAMVIDCFLAAGLKEFQIEIGQIEFFKGLVEEPNINQETEDTIRELIQNKNFFGVEDLANRLNLEKETKEMLIQFRELHGGFEIIEKAKQLTNNKRALNALKRLNDLHEILTCYGYDKYVSYDLGMLNLYNYYTGIIFQGYTYGTGDAVVKGGRYDNLLRLFGKDASSIGFAFVVDDLLKALQRQKIASEIDASATLFIYEKPQQKICIELAMQYRNQGLAVELIEKSSAYSSKDYIEYSKQRGIGGICCFEQPDKVDIISVNSGETSSFDLQKFLKGDLS